LTHSQNYRLAKVGSIQVEISWQYASNFWLVLAKKSMNKLGGRYFYESIYGLPCPKITLLLCPVVASGVLLYALEIRPRVPQHHYVNDATPVSQQLLSLYVIFTKTI
jgi:hypothetical protein